MACETDIDKLRCLAFNSLATSMKADGYRMADCEGYREQSCKAAMYAYVLASGVEMPNQVNADAIRFLNSTERLETCGSVDEDCYEKITCDTSVEDIEDDCEDITVEDIRMPL